MKITLEISMRETEDMIDLAVELRNIRNIIALKVPDRIVEVIKVEK